jgi:methionyl-tRNA formyltransferase
MKLKDARIIFMGTSFFAKEILKNLIESEIKINLVITQPDKPAGRKKELKSSEIKIFTQKNNLKLAQFPKLNENAISEIEKIKPDLILVVAYGLIIPPEIIKQPPYECVNIHPSLLPKLRGSSPIQTALLEGFEKTGTTIMKIDSSIDSGEIIAQKTIQIKAQDIYPALEKNLLKITNKILIKTLDDYLEKKITPKPQNHEQASFTKIIKKQDGQIDWTETSEKIYNKFRAFYDWPQIYTFWTNKGKTKKITLTEIALTNQTKKDKKIGEVYQENNQVLVNAKQGSLILEKIKLEGKNNLTIKDFLNGNPALIGSILK